MSSSGGINGNGPSFISGINAYFIRFGFPKFPNEFQSRLNLKIAELVNSKTEVSSYHIAFHKKNKSAISSFNLKLRVMRY